MFDTASEKMRRFLAWSKERMQRLIALYHPQTLRSKGIIWSSGLALVTLVVLMLLLSFIWSSEPDRFSVTANAQAYAEESGGELVTGFTTTAAAVQVAEVMLNKPGGYLSNDLLPPGVWLDNIPNWEFGVLVQLRDLTTAMRNDFSRSQSQSVEDSDLLVAQPQFSFDSASWLFPATESEYSDGIEALKSYLFRLNDANEQDAQFYARADNLAGWLGVVEKRLGSLSQRLSESIGTRRINTDLAGDSAATQSTPRPSQIDTKTPWLEIDDIFYEARGNTWALIHFLKAVEIDFAQVLEKKNATVSLRQIIRELEATQQTVWSPMVLNGSGFGLLANHSLVMSSYISRANAAVIDLRNLLTDG